MSGRKNAKQQRETRRRPMSKGRWCTRRAGSRRLGGICEGGGESAREKRSRREEVRKKAGLGEEERERTGIEMVRELLEGDEKSQVGR